MATQHLWSGDYFAPQRLANTPSTPNHSSTSEGGCFAFLESWKRRYDGFATYPIKSKFQDVCDAVFFWVHYELFAKDKTSLENLHILEKIKFATGFVQLNGYTVDELLLSIVTLPGEHGGERLLNPTDVSEKFDLMKILKQDRSLTPNKATRTKGV